MRQLFAPDHRCCDGDAGLGGLPTDCARTCLLGKGFGELPTAVKTLRRVLGQRRLKHRVQAGQIRAALTERREQQVRSNAD